MNILELIIQDPNTSNDILVKIAKYAMARNDLKLLQKIASHPRASTSTLAMVNRYIEKCECTITEKYIDILKIGAENPKTTDDVLAAIAKFAIERNNEELLKKVANHPLASASTLAMIKKNNS